MARAGRWNGFVAYSASCVVSASPVSVREGEELRGWLGSTKTDCWSLGGRGLVIDREKLLSRCCVSRVSHY